ncbi:hypothetical protein PoB_003126100 [Plakobranchus ocellatus]|uniref:Uncharacterized protein n=1 Tax=Plakobranchus ocellatus TaxID=259542 RepID=A0AAV4ADN7_9GAST|nr:hypothetical protein PoB_003126100 [Plakobranchus ocellatus]
MTTTTTLSPLHHRQYDSHHNYNHHQTAMRTHNIIITSISPLSPQPSVSHTITPAALQAPPLPLCHTASATDTTICTHSHSPPHHYHKINTTLLSRPPQPHPDHNPITATNPYILTTLAISPPPLPPHPSPQFSLHHAPSTTLSPPSSMKPHTK